MSENVQQAITAAFKGSRQAWLELLVGEKQGNPNLKMSLGVLHPTVLELLAAAVDVKLPPTPQWAMVEARS